MKKANFIDSLRDSFAKNDLEKNGSVLMDDSDIDQLGKRSASRLPESFAIGNDMKQLINELTRMTEYSKTLIDLLFTNREHKIVQSGIIHTTLSDHSLVFCVVKGGAQGNLNIGHSRMIIRWNSQMILVKSPGQ